MLLSTRLYQVYINNLSEMLIMYTGTRNYIHVRAIGYSYRSLRVEGLREVGPDHLTS